MQKRLFAVALFGLACLSPISSASAQSPTIAGLWRGDGGDVRVQPCPGSSKQCVVVVAGSDKPVSMSDIIGQTVVVDILPAEANIWRGRYVADGENLPAKFTLLKPDVVEMKACLFSWFPWLRCETLEYKRVGQ